MVQWSAIRTSPVAFQFFDACTASALFERAQRGGIVGIVGCEGVELAEELLP